MIYQEDLPSVAEAMLMLKKEITFVDLLEATAMELLMLDVLAVEHEWRLPHPRQTEERLYTYIKKGSNFYKFKPKKHQKPFLDAIAGSKRKLFYPRDYFKLVLNDIGNVQRYHFTHVLAAMRHEGYIKSRILYHLLGNFVLTAGGKRAKEETASRLSSIPQQIGVSRRTGDFSGLASAVGALGVFSIMLGKTSVQYLIEAMPSMESVLASSNVLLPAEHGVIAHIDTLNFMAGEFSLLETAIHGGLEEVLFSIASSAIDAAAGAMGGSS